MFQNWCYPGCILELSKLKPDRVSVIFQRVFIMAGRCFLGLGLLLVCVFWGARLSHITTAQVGKEKTNNKGRRYKYRHC